MVRQLLVFSLLFGSVFLFSPSVGQEYQQIPKLEQRVTDLTNTLSTSQISNIERTLAEFEKDKGSQIAVLFVATTKPETIEQFAIKVVEQWKIGRKGIDDGVLLLIAKEDRKMRIEVGYGLEGAIPDAYSKRIIEQIIKPEFRAGDFYHGVTKAVDALKALISGEELPGPGQANNQADGEGVGKYLHVLFPLLIVFVAVGNYLLKKLLGKKWGTLAFFVVLFIIGTIAINFIAGLFIAVLLTFMWGFPGGGSGTGGRRGGGGWYVGGFGGSSSGGGFGGGFSGGFSGGGGSFGGGGASGGW